MLVRKFCVQQYARFAFCSIRQEKEVSEMNCAIVHGSIKDFHQNVS